MVSGRAYPRAQMQGAFRTTRCDHSVSDRAGASIGLRLGHKLSLSVLASAKSIYAVSIVRASFHLFSKLVVFSGNG
jgi:hypothetical protein